MSRPPVPKWSCRQNMPPAGNYRLCGIRHRTEQASRMHSATLNLRQLKGTAEQARQPQWEPQLGT